MNFEAFHKVPRNTEKYTETKIGQDLYVEKEGDNVTAYRKQKVIDGLEYWINLTKLDKHGIAKILSPGTWSLAFGTDNAYSITNKGLGTYRKIIDEIEILVQQVLKYESVEIIIFEGLEDDTHESDLAFLGVLNQAYTKNQNAFDGFEYHSQDEDRHALFYTDINIIGDTVYINHSKNLKKSIANYLKTKKESTPETASLGDLLSNPNEFFNFFDTNPDLINQLCKYVGSDFVLSSRTSKNSAKQRIDLYERTLKQRFPQYKILRKGNHVAIKVA